MDIIVAVDADWGIGKDGDLLQRISADMKYFREKTTGNVLVMGRKTLNPFRIKSPCRTGEYRADRKIRTIRPRALC